MVLYHEILLLLNCLVRFDHLFCFFSPSVFFILILVSRFSLFLLFSFSSLSLCVCLFLFLSRSLHLHSFILHPHAAYLCLSPHLSVSVRVVFLFLSLPCRSLFLSCTSFYRPSRCKTRSCNACLKSLQTPAGDMKRGWGLFRRV